MTDNQTHNQNLFQGANISKLKFARQLRQEMTAAEKLLWEQLRNNKLKGYKFRRQHAISDYVLDFYCHQAKLAIEVDGVIHLSIRNSEYDDSRDRNLNQLGITVLRTTNEEVEKNIRTVLIKIENKLIELDNKK